MNPVQVEVLLATYNGAAYLMELLDSLFAQSMQDFRILARDDGSTDETLAILSWYAANHAEKLIILPDRNPSGSPSANFSHLLKASSAPYVMLCDQDDVWLPEKIALSLAAIKNLEEENDPGTPLLVHSDLAVVDEKLDPIAPSFFEFSGLNPGRDQFHQLLVQNMITGCASILNRALVRMVTPIPVEARMHDWWIALAASGMGEVGVIPQATILYRQHGKNALGANRFNMGYIIRKAKGLWDEAGKSILHENFRQAKAFRERYAANLSVENLAVLDQFNGMQSENFIKRRVTCLRQGFTKGKFSQNIGLMLRL